MEVSINFHIFPLPSSPPFRLPTATMLTHNKAKYSIYYTLSL